MHETEIANEHFNKARASELWRRVFSVLKPEDHELLSLHDVRKVLRTTGESYRGYKSVPIDKIIGSEGRYRDFSRTYLPRREHSRTRWTSIDRAHQKDVVLPAVNVYEIAGCYFVRDGNHRVSVARAMGMQEIDAIIVQLDTKIPLGEGTTKSSLKRQVIGYEREEFHNKTDFQTFFPDIDIVFTETGRYNELTTHFEGHHRYLQKTNPSASLKEAMRSWAKDIYLPIIDIITKERVLSRFPRRTVADLYMWIIKHRDELQAVGGRAFPIKDVVRDLSRKYGKNRMERAMHVVKRLLKLFRRS